MNSNCTLPPNLLMILSQLKKQPFASNETTNFLNFSKHFKLYCMVSINVQGVQKKRSKSIAFLNLALKVH